MSENKNSFPAITENPEELIFRSCYAPFDVRDYLQSAETRSLIRKLPAAQLFFSIQELDEEEMALLLPQLTEEQWTTFLDLDLWDKDEVNTGALLHWTSFTLETDDPVARKLLRATDHELLQLLWRREIQVIPRVEEDEFEQEPPLDRDTFITPDNDYLIVLPEDPEKSRLIHSFIQRLYHLEAEYAQMCLANSQYVTSIELEETAFRNRCLRSEDNGFQDYFDALEIYTPRSPGSPLPEKDDYSGEVPKDLPVPVAKKDESRFIFIEALASISRQEEIESLLQEMFFVCNKIISADRTFAGDPENIKNGISKALNGINLGLDIWSGGDLHKAADGILRHFLASFFQIGYGALLKVNRTAAATANQEPGSYGEVVMEGLKSPYPLFTESEEDDGKITFSTRYFQTAADIDQAMDLLGELGIRE